VKNSIWKFLATCCSILTIGLSIATPALAESQAADSGYFNGEVGLGYRNIWLDNDKSRVLEYVSLNNGATANLVVDAGAEQKRLNLAGNFITDQDYRGDLDLDINGLVRVELATDKMVHNLEHFPYNRPDGYLTYDDLSPQDQYQIEISQNSADAKLKHPNFPAHLKLGFSRQEKTGHQQLRFVDEGNGGLNGNGSCGKCHLQSTTRSVDWTTDQISAGIDAHVGPLDLAVDHIYREFRDHAGTPVDIFGSHGFLPNLNRVGPAAYQHDEAPDSQLSKTTIKANTSLAGGVVGVASASFGTMKNESRLVDVTPVRAETDFYQLAGDATYIINPQWTLNARYRMADFDSEIPEAITASGTLPANGPLAVRDSVDITRSSYEARVTYHPTRNYSIKGEYRYLDIDRGNTAGPVDFAVSGGVIVSPDLSWELPEQETVQRFKLAFNARPLGSRKLRIKARYAYETAEDSAYGTSYEDRHDLYGGATWTSGNRWGLHGSARYSKEENNSWMLFLPDGSGNPFPFIQFNPTRDREVTNLVAGVWLAPAKRLTINTNYGYLQTEIRQDLVFGGQPSETSPTDPDNFAIVDDEVPFDQAVHTATVMIDVRILDNLGCTLEGRHIKSKSSFEPNFPVTTLLFDGVPVDMTSDDLKEISEVDIIQTGLTIGFDWQPQTDWSCSASYSYDDFDDHSNASLEGTAQMVMASLAYRW